MTDTTDITDMVERVAKAMREVDPLARGYRGDWPAYVTTARAAMEVTLTEFAARLDESRPSAVQLAISPDYNSAAIRALTWAAKEARSLADAAKPPP